MADQALGGYDALLFFCWEEYEFCLRAIAQGWRIRYRGDVAIRHKVSGDRRVTWSGRRWFFFVRNRLYIERKYGAGWVALLPRCTGYLVKGLRNGVLLQTLRALAAAVRLARHCPHRVLPDAVRRYLRENDAAHRGTWLNRLSGDMVARLPPALPVRTPATARLAASPAGDARARLPH